MKYHYHTINTGHCSHHDSAVDIAPGIAEYVWRLIQPGAGAVPGCRGAVAFKFSDVGWGAALSVALPIGEVADAPLWVCQFYRDASGAACSLAALGSTADGLGADRGLFAGVRWPVQLPAPGLATLILPPIALAERGDILLLADFAKCAFFAWFSFGQHPRK